MPAARRNAVGSRGRNSASKSSARALWRALSIRLGASCSKPELLAGAQVFPSKLILPSQETRSFSIKKADPVTNWVALGILAERFICISPSFHLPYH